MEGSICVNGAAIEIELKHRVLGKVETDLDSAIDTASQWSGGHFRGPSIWFDLDRSLYALRGIFEITEGTPEKVATEMKMTLEGAGYRVTLNPPQSL